MEPVKSSGGKFGLAFLRFLMHLAVVYLVANFLVLWLIGQFHDRILPLLGMSPDASRFQFAFNHLLLFGVVCGLCSGIIVAGYNHRAAQFVWAVPAAILAFKFITFPSSLFANHVSLAFHHYLAGGFLIPEFHSYREMFAGWSPDYERGLDQVRFTLPVYVSTAYGCASWAGARLGIRLPLRPLLGLPPHRLGGPDEADSP
jgi:hypothetical protein